MSEYIVDTFGIVRDLAELHGDMSTPLYLAIMDVILSRQHDEIVRCRDCDFSHEDELGNLRCCGSLTEPWDYYNDEPSDGVKIESSGYCAWGEWEDDNERL